MYTYIYIHTYIYKYISIYISKPVYSFSQLRQLGDQGIQTNQFNLTSRIKNLEFGSQGRNQSLLWYKDMCSQLAYSANTCIYRIASHQECQN